jgi:cell wall-associated NlpC family hydrolase
MRVATASRILAAALAVAIMTPAVLSPGIAAATPSTPEIEAKRAEANAAQAELDRMNDELEIQVEEYNAITEALEQTRQEIDVTRVQLEQAKADLAAAQDALARRATNIYKDRGTGVLDVFLGARTFQDFLVRLDLAVRINRSDADTVAAVKEAKAAVETAELALEQREAEQVTLRADAEIRAERIQAEIDKQESYVAALDSQVKRLIADEEERQRKLAEERARQAAAAAAKYGSTGRTAADPSALGSGHPEVVPIALKFLGVPYAWGGASPSGFDCSGLCQYVYKQIGITLPRTSSSQYRVGQHIAPDRLDLLKPGDLVFFGTDGDPNRVHHVGIYVGGGNFVHAPQRGDVVKVSSLTDRIATRGDYVGASRF